jgi:hypothetical protein
MDSKDLQTVSNTAYFYIMPTPKTQFSITRNFIIGTVGMIKARVKMGRKRNAHEILIGRDHFEDLSINGRVILNLVSMKFYVKTDDGDKPSYSSLGQVSK